jgi:hypothetical protein
MVDMLFDLSPKKSLGYWFEAGRQLGYQRLRKWRARMRQRFAVQPRENGRGVLRAARNALYYPGK